MSSRTERIINKPLEARSTIELLRLMGDCSQLDFQDFVTSLQTLHARLRDPENPPTKREKVLITLISCSADAPQANLGLHFILLNLPPQESEPMFATIFSLARAPETKASIEKILRPPAGTTFQQHIRNLIYSHQEFHQAVQATYDPETQQLPPEQLPTVHHLAYSPLSP